MKRSLLGLALAMAALAAASRTAAAYGSCPDTLYYVPGGYTCNLLGGADCRDCRYACNTNPISYGEWNTCSIPT